MKKIIYVLTLPLVVVSGLVFANHEVKNKTAAAKPLSVAEIKAKIKREKASPAGIRYAKWEVSAEGKKAHISAGKLNKHLRAFTNIEAVVTSLSGPSRISGFGVMVSINGETYALNFGPGSSVKRYIFFNDNTQGLNSLRVNDKIIIKARRAGYIADYPYSIILGEYAERDGNVIFKRPARKGGC